MTLEKTLVYKRSTRADEVADAIRQRISAGIYVDQLPGMALLADELGYNARTVMRGLAVLESEGLVSRQSRRGTFITRLKRPRTNTIGLVFGGVNAPLGAKLSAGMQAAAASAEQGLTLGSYEHNRDAQMEQVRNLIERNQVDGLVLWLIGDDVHKEAAAYLNAENIPFVMIPDYDPSCQVDFHTVSGADQGATADVMTHLLGRGYREIAFAADFELKGRIYHQHRYEEYRRTLSLAGITPQEVKIHCGASSSYDDAQIVKKLKKADAVFCETDNVAASVYQICVREGIRIPDDLAVVGFDNTPVAGMLGLSSVEQHFELIGQKAVGLLLDDIDGKLKYPTHLEVEAELIVRGSSLSAREYSKQRLKL